jgi:predicted DNA-binding transcriptional regulator AlpA
LALMGLNPQVKRQDPESQKFPTNKILNQGFGCGIRFLAGASGGMSVEPSIFLNAKQAATLLGVSYSHYRGLVAQGVLPPPDRRLGRPLWLREALLAWARGESYGAEGALRGKPHDPDTPIDWG